MRSGYCYRKTGCSPLSFLFFGEKIVFLFQTSKFYVEKTCFRILIQRKVVPLQRVSLEARIFLLLNFPVESPPRKRNKGQIQMYIEAALQAQSSS